VFLTLTLFTLASFFRSLPAIFSFMGEVIYMFLRLSYLTYRFIFTTVFSWLDSSLPTGVWRVILTTLLSLLIFNGLFFLVIFPIGVWVSGFALVHGLFVGVFWDKLDDPFGLNLGVKMS